MNLTQNFSLEELTKSEIALRKNMDNTPDQEALDNLQLLCENVLQPLRDAYKRGIKVNSAYRSPDVNTAVGGVRTSDHCKGQAADIEIPGVSNVELAQYLADNFEFTQVILEFFTQGVPDSGWVHVSYNPDNLKRQVLTAVKQNGKTVYLNGIQA